MNSAPHNQGDKNQNSNIDIESLNKSFYPLNYKERIAKLYKLFSIKEVLLTSSFGTRSAFLIHLFNKIQPEQEITFINTTYHFPETIYYKNKLIKKYQLKVKEILPDPIQNNLTTQERWWNDHPNMCCTVNKIAPLDALMGKYKIWVSGLIAFQTPHRSRLRIFESQGDIIKFHPLIDIEEGEYLYQKGFHSIPDHPLTEEGYGSIGCIHCTNKGDGREGRWINSKKTECGLHTNFYYKNKTE